MDGIIWTGEEVKELRKLRLDPIRNTHARLRLLVAHFLTPGAGVFAITPICPHTLSNRAVIVSQQSTVEVRMLDQRRESTLSADGWDVVGLDADSPVTINRSRRTVKLARLPETSFFQTLRQKLQWMGSHA